MEKPEKLTESHFLQVVKGAPLVSMDIAFTTGGNRILLGLRTNEPARGFWFLPGGRIMKGETLEQAFKRIAGFETGMDLAFGDARMIGVFQHFYDSNFAGAPNLGTHYVSLAYAIDVNPDAPLRADDQHSDLSWWTTGDALESPSVHPYTKEIIDREF